MGARSVHKLILSGCLIVKGKKILLLYRKDHKHYETPGGKTKLEECINPQKPSLDELKKAALRELHEELGARIKVGSIEYFDSVEFRTPDGREALAHKFITEIFGDPILNEPEIHSRFDFLPIVRLEEYPLSPDLYILLPKIRERFSSS